MAADFSAPPTTGIASLAEQRAATIEALRRELLGYRRSGKAARAQAVIDELKRLGVDVLAEEKAAAKAAADAEAAEKAAARAAAEAAKAEKPAKAEAEKPAGTQQATA